MPPNATLVLTEMKNAIEMNALPKKEIKEFIKGNELVESMMKSGGMLAIITIPLLILGLIVLVFLIWASKKYVRLANLVTKIKKALFFNLFIRAMIVSYISKCVSARFGSLYELHDTDKSINYPVALYLCVVIAACYLLALYVEPQELEMSRSKEIYGSIYQAVRTRNTKTMLAPMMFFIRRILFVMALQTHIFSLQFGGILFIVLIQISFYLDALPYDSRAQNKLEIFNELFLMTMLYMLPLFTKWVPDVKVQYGYGWVFVYTFAPLFMINIGYVIMLAIDLCLLKCKKKKYQKGAKKQAVIDLIADGEY